ncbi:MAG TPA: aspartate aminotransferase family protein [Actinomycetota bacterium]|nr:aspartate aminotransferase family protein [Actinomycetota bacterium]
MPVRIDPARVEALTQQQSAALAEKLPRSIEFAKRASQSLAGGVACTWHALDPYTIYGSRGQGSRIWDLDDNEYVDLHCGYGVMVAGHAHPRVVEAVRERVGLGTHFAMPVEDTVVVAELLAERFGLPLWRFKNSGSEATMDTCRVMRAATGRDLLIKVEGSYHGSSDGLAWSYWVDAEQAGPADRPVAVHNTAGLPEAFGSVLRIVPFNDLEAVERVLADEGDRVAGMILEPILMNCGVIQPEPAYLAGLRDLLHRHGALLAFDEVKTGVTIAAGGATEWSGVRPDLVAVAKAIGGGIPVAAVGGTEEAMRVLVDGTLEWEGTFNGNPLSMAAARATLTEVLTPDVYERFEAQNARLTAALRDVIARYDLPATVSTVRCRGSIHFRAEPVRTFRDAAGADGPLQHLAWLHQLNAGVFPPAGDPWTFSVAHTDEDLDRYVEAFETFAGSVTA